MQGWAGCFAVGLSELGKEGKVVLNQERKDARMGRIGYCDIWRDGLYFFTGDV